MGISTSAAAALFSPPRKYYFEVYLLGLSLLPRRPRRCEAPLFFALFYFSFICDSPALSLFLARILPLFAPFLSRSSPLSLSLSLSFSFSLFSAHTFLRGEGARPGAAVNKYDTGIGYKETINHPSGTRAPQKPR